MRKLKIFTWHIHGNYLWYLSALGHEFYLPVGESETPGYGGLGKTFPFGENVHEIPKEEVRRQSFDCLLFQHRDNYCQDQYRLFTAAQRRLPQIYLEHDPPLQHPTEQRHWYDKREGMLVHVTPFNALMWNSGETRTRVIEHGVPCRRKIEYTGEIPRGLTIINNLGTRGRRLGPDIFEEARRSVPIDLVGMGSEPLGGIGEVSPPRLASFEARYRFIFNPIRYTSLGLAICEAMMLGIPIVGLATTEMATAIESGVTGYVDTSVARLIEPMRRLIDDPEEARRLGRNARRYARKRFSLKRFLDDWNRVLAEVTDLKTALPERETTCIGALR
jgi:hypothetical protein